MLGQLSQGQGGEGGQRIASRNHYREIRKTPETPNPVDLEQLERWREALGGLLAAEIPAEKSWYKVGRADVPIIAERSDRQVAPLSEYSSVVANIQPIRLVWLFVKPEDLSDAEKQLKSLGL